MVWLWKTCCVLGIWILFYTGKEYLFAIIILYIRDGSLWSNSMWSIFFKIQFRNAIFSIINANRSNVIVIDFISVTVLPNLSLFTVFIRCFSLVTNDPSTLWEIQILIFTLRTHFNSSINKNRRIHALFWTPSLPDLIHSNRHCPFLCPLVCSFVWLSLIFKETAH